MEKNRKDGNQSKRFALIVSLLVGVLLLAGQPAVPVSAAEEGSVEAGVTVVTPAEESYGAHVTKSYRVFSRWWSLGEPDYRGAVMLYKGWIIIELENMVTNCNQVSIWTARWGWWSTLFKVYVSSDGKSWQYIGNGKCRTRRFTRYDFTGSFQDVKYIKVARTSSGRWSSILLDAVRAKGGGA